MPDPLKKRYSLPGGVATHLFEGEISGNSFGGLHSEAVKNIDNGGIRLSGGWPPGQLARRTAGKSYWANIEVKIGGKWYGPGMSSFFPLPGRGNHWDKDTIIRMIEQSLTDPTDAARSSREEWTSSPRAVRKGDDKKALKIIKVGGVRCKVQHQEGGIVSIYPLVPTD